MTATLAMAASMRRPFKTVILDADSTLSSLEGIDWLAALRGPELEQRVKEQTDASMRGDIRIDAVYGARLSVVAPTAAELDALGVAYCATVEPDAARVIAAGQARGMRFIIVSGGLRRSLLPLGAMLGLPPEDVHAVEVWHDATGAYTGYDAASPLGKDGGKPTVVRGLKDLASPVLAVGDGQTDAALHEVVDAFWAYVGFVERPSVAARGDRVVRSFRELGTLLELI